METPGGVPALIGTDVLGTLVLGMVDRGVVRGRNEVGVQREVVRDQVTSAGVLAPGEETAGSTSGRGGGSDGRVSKPSVHSGAEGASAPSTGTAEKELAQNVAGARRASLWGGAEAGRTSAVVGKTLVQDEGQVAHRAALCSLGVGRVSI